MLCVHLTYRRRLKRPLRMGQSTMNEQYGNTGVTRTTGARGRMAWHAGGARTPNTGRNR